MAHNICSYPYNLDSDCACEGGPSSTDDCLDWFRQLWEEQQEWLQLHLSNSTADWQIIVTHFPPTFDREFFGNLSLDYGVDLFVTGHLHRQEVHGADDEDNFLAPTAWVISGGGGGITSDFLPDLNGDSQYGFMHMTLSNDSIEVVNVQHTGAEGDRVVVFQRPCVLCSQDDVAHNLRVYQEGLQRRGLNGAPRFSSSTVTTVTTATTSFTTANQTSQSILEITAVAKQAVHSISDEVLEMKKAGRDVSNRTFQDLAAGETAVVSMASETAHWMGREMTAGESKVVNETRGRRELLRASGAVHNAMSSPSGVASVGTAAALAAVLALWLCSGGATARRPGVTDCDPDASRELIQIIRADVAPHLSNEGDSAPAGQAPPAEEALVDDDQVWNPP